MVKYIVALILSLFVIGSLPHVVAAEMSNEDINPGVSPRSDDQSYDDSQYNDSQYDDSDEPPLADGAEEPPPPADESAVAPPPVEFAQPPDVVAVPSDDSSVYMVANMPGFYFYDGFWYRYHRGYWFRSNIYNGSWAYVRRSFVPRVVWSVPPEYIRFLPRGYHRIHYFDLHRNWRTWQRARYWNRFDWYRHEMRQDIRRDRFRHIQREREERRRTGDHWRRDRDRDRRSPDRDRRPQGMQNRQGQDRRPQGMQNQQGQDRRPQGMKNRQGQDRRPQGMQNRQGQDRRPQGEQNHKRKGKEDDKK